MKKPATKPTAELTAAEPCHSLFVKEKFGLFSAPVDLYAEYEDGTARKIVALAFIHDEAAIEPDWIWPGALVCGMFSDLTPPATFPGFIRIAPREAFGQGFNVVG